MKETLDLSSLRDQFENGAISDSIEDESDRRINIVHQLLNDIFEFTPTCGEDFSNDSSTFKEKKTKIFENIEHMFMILSSGRSNKNKQDNLFDDCEDGILLLHQILHTSLQDKSLNFTRNVRNNKNSNIIPSHLFLWELINNTRTSYYSFTENAGEWIRPLLVLIFFSYGLEYTEKETRYKMDLNETIRWKRIKSLVLDSFRTIYNMLDNMTNEMCNDDHMTEHSSEPKNDTNFHFSVIFVVKKHLMPAFHKLISIHPEPIDMIIAGVGLLSFIFDVFSSTHATSADIDLCQWFIKLTTTSITSNFSLTLDLILSHPLRTMQVANLKKQRLFRRRRKIQLQKNIETTTDMNADNFLEEEDDDDLDQIQYSGNELFNKLANVTDLSCTTFVPWHQQGIALFAKALVCHGRHLLDFPAVYSPEYFFQMFFPHACTLLLHVSTEAGLQYLHLLPQHIPSTTTSNTFARPIPTLPNQCIVNTCQLLLNTQKSEGIQLLRNILTHQIHPANSIICIEKLIKKCPFPNAIPLLLDTLSVFMFDYDCQEIKQTRANTTGILRIIYPFVLEMKNYNSDDEELLQMFEIYSCVITLLRRALLQQGEYRLKIRYDKELDASFTETMKKIKTSWSIAEEFSRKIESRIDKFGEDKFRLFLLQDALTQFISAAKFFFLMI